MYGSYASWVPTSPGREPFARASGGDRDRGYTVVAGGTVTVSGSANCF
jgi:hypothetical protein